MWAVSAMLVGLTAATYDLARDAAPPAPDRGRRTLAATLLSALAVGCSICNKLVVALIGVSGALTYWAPLQPVLDALSIALLVTALAVRLRGQLACAPDNH